MSPSRKPQGPDEPAHDILAAEAFAMGEGDPELHRKPAHDVLAAEEFALPAPERHAVPPDYAGPGPDAGGRPSNRAPLVLGACAVVAVWLIRRRSR